MPCSQCLVSSAQCMRLCKLWQREFTRWHAAVGAKRMAAGDIPACEHHAEPICWRFVTAQGQRSGKKQTEQQHMHRVLQKVLQSVLHVDAECCRMLQMTWTGKADGVSTIQKLSGPTTRPATGSEGLRWQAVDSNQRKKNGGSVGKALARGWSEQGFRL